MAKRHRIRKKSCALTVSDAKPLGRARSRTGVMHRGAFFCPCDPRGRFRIRCLFAIRCPIGLHEGRNARCQESAVENQASPTTWQRERSNETARPDAGRIRPHVATVRAGRRLRVGHASLEVDDLLTVGVAAGAEDLHGQDGRVLRTVDGDAGHGHAGGHLHHGQQ